MRDSPPDKTALRRQAMRCRDTLDAEALSLAIREVLAAWPPFLRATRVLAYHPLPGEMDLLPLTARFSDKQWFLPRVEAGGGLVFLAYQAGDSLETHRFGMQEPVADAAPFSAGGGGDSCLALIPGLMFDPSGVRLGYGKGYYDRFLASNPELTRVGIVPSPLMADALPCQPWDMRMHYLATETGILPVL